MIIREALADDAGAIAHVQVASWRTTYRGIVPDDVLERLSIEPRERHWAAVTSDSATPEFVFVAEDASQQIVGFASGGPEREGHPNYRGELYAIYLLAPYQRRGIGQHLTLAVVERLLQLGYPTMLVWVLADNPSRHFYEALGGHLVATKPITIGGVTLEEVAYGWDDLRALARRLRSTAA